MFGYVLKKIFIFIVSLFFIISLTFFLMKAIPGDPFTQDQELPKEILENLHKHYGLDKPLHVQYFQYLKNCIKLDFGPSYIYQGRTVNQIIKENFATSLILGAEALFIAVPLGIFLGSLAALKKNKKQDAIAMIIAILGISIPNFLLATLLQYVFSIKLKLLPIARWEGFAYSILPAISLAATPMAFIARLVRSNMIEVLEQDYIKTAYAKGLTNFQVVLKHGLRNAILPVISYLGPIITYLITGSFVIEKIFAIPGLGQWLIHSINNRDYTVIMGLTIFFSILFMSIILLADIASAIIDPRIKIIYQKNKL